MRHTHRKYMAEWRVERITPWFGRVIGCLWPVVPVRWQFGVVLVDQMLVVRVIEHRTSWAIDFVRARFDLNPPA